MADETQSQSGVNPPTDPSAEAAAASMATEALDSAQKAVDDLQSVADPGQGPQPAALPDFQQMLAEVEAGGLDMLHDVQLNVKIELGRTRMLVEDVLRLAEGSVVELDKLAGEPVDVFVNDRLVARGDVLVVNDSFCVRVSELVQDPAAAGSLASAAGGETDDAAATAAGPAAAGPSGTG